MKVGDLVRHSPEGCTAAQLFEDWGHERNFDCGIIIDDHENSNYFRVSAAPSYRPKWYQVEELELISEGE